MFNPSNVGRGLSRVSDHSDLVDVFDPGHSQRIVKIASTRGRHARRHEYRTRLPDLTAIL
ncbi:MAG: hypothetical protein JWQ64_1775 [Subtercola sp.]|nr:hypothetical protein [Subtercola sp.]